MKMIRIPNHLEHLVSKTIKHYQNATPEFQRLIRITNSVQGRYGKQYILQLSHGTQQIKLYEPEKYQTDKQTPLRYRTRVIFKLTEGLQWPDNKLIIPLLFRSYPFCLLKNRPINLRMKNFYFEKMISKGDLISIYKAIDPGNPLPANDIIYLELPFSPKKTIMFQFQETDEEYYYAVNKRNGELSNVLHFIWSDDYVQENRRYIGSGFPIIT